MNRQELMHRIQETGFALTDLNLFLDSHPTNAPALEYFRDVKMQHAELVAQYEMMFGPLTAFDVDTKTVLMLAYMNKESLKKTLETGYTWYWSRSRQEYWNKGATSGHLQKVVSIYADCDNDTILLNVKQTGAACHTGSYSCFFNEMYKENEE